jgi:spoIIIJ-associated protein
MKTIKAKSLEDAFTEASATYKCSITELQYEVVQNPSSGFLGLFKKEAIIVVTQTQQDRPVEEKIVNKEDIKEEITLKVQESEQEEETPKDSKKPQTNSKEEIKEDKKPYHVKTSTMENGFFEDTKEPDAIANEIKNDIDDLFSKICFEIDEIKVSMYDEETVYIELNGKDAALLIGKEGYRYKALSYMLFNWINSKYSLQIRLEIAEFLQNQEEAIDRYLDGVCENIERDGRAQTKILDGVLVQIALKKLRLYYPQKYVAIRTTKDGSKYIIINNYNNNNNER